jgi:hypothetical protein
MARIDHAIIALDILGSVVQAVPVVGENLKAATEIAKKLCEMAKVRIRSSALHIRLHAMQKMKDNREGYEQLADRAARLLAAVANTIMKADSEKLKGMEGNVACLLMCVVFLATTRINLTRLGSILQEIKTGTDTRLKSPSAATGKLMRIVRAKGKNIARTSADLEELKKLGEKLDRAVEEFDVSTYTRVTARIHPVSQVTSSIRVELVVEDVRALALSLSKYLDEMKLDISGAAMNGLYLILSGEHTLILSHQSHTWHSSPCPLRTLGRSQR